MVYIDEYLEEKKTNTNFSIFFFFNSIVDNELNLSEEDTCQNNCEDFTLTRHVRCADKTLCAENRRNELAVCNGVIRNCKELPSERIEVCYTDNPIRRMNFLMESNGKVYGSKPEKTVCSSVNYVIKRTFYEN